MNIRWNLILSIIAFGLLGWFYSLNRDAPDLSNLVKKPDSPDYIGNKSIYSMLIHLILVKQRMLLMLWYHRVGN